MLSYVALILTLIPVISILAEAFKNGLPVISIGFLLGEIPPIGEPGGGIGPAIQGTLIIMGLASLIGVPIGLFSGIYLAEYPYSKISLPVRFLNEVMTYVPSIVVGVFAWSLIVTIIGWSVIAGAIALAIMMIPVVTRTAEEALKLVSRDVREAAIALGIPYWKVVLSVVIKSAKTGIATGVFLAIARIAGETAPLLFTILGSRFWFSGFNQPTAALPLLIYDLSQSPFVNIDFPKAWGAALILILIVVIINSIVKYMSRQR